MLDVDNIQEIDDTSQRRPVLQREAQRDYPSIDHDTYEQISNIIDSDSVNNTTRRLMPLYANLGFRHGWDRGKDFPKAYGRGDAAELKDLESLYITNIHEALDSRTVTPELLTYLTNLLSGVRSAYFDSNVSAYRGRKPINFPEEKLIQRIVKLESQQSNVSPEDQYFTEQESLSPEASRSQQQLERIHPVFLDDNGRPKVIYHGSPRGWDINECGYFDESFYGKNTGVRDSSEGYTVFASDNYEVAETYSQPLHYERIEDQKEFFEDVNKIIESLDKSLDVAKSKIFNKPYKQEQDRDQRIETTADYVLRNDLTLDEINEKYSSGTVGLDLNRTDRIIAHVFDDGSKIYIYHDKYNYDDNLEPAYQKVADQGQHDALFIKKAIASRDFWKGYISGKQLVVPIHVLSQNPLIVDGSDFRHRGPEKFSITDNINRARKEGHDSLVIENISDTLTGESIPATQYAVWDTERIIDAETGRSLAKSQEICELQERETPPEDQYFTEQESLSPEASRAQQQLERIHPVFLDDKGRPKVIYHGSPTGRKIDECGYFDEEYYGDNTGVRKESKGFTIYGSDNEDVAATYMFGQRSYYPNLDQQRKHEYSLNRNKNRIEEAKEALEFKKQNPGQIYYIDEKIRILSEFYDDSIEDIEKFIQNSTEGIPRQEIALGYKRQILPIHILSQNPLIVDGSTFNAKTKDFSITDHVNKAQNEGYDSLVIENIDDPYFTQVSIPATQYAVWDPERIISAETGRSLAKSQEICELQEHETPPEDQYFTEQENLSPEASRAQQQLERVHPVFLDDKGNPKVIYHGSPTGRKIDECGYFDESLYGRNTGTKHIKNGFTISATDSEDVAETYSYGNTYESFIRRDLGKQKSNEEELQLIHNELESYKNILEEREKNQDLLPDAEKAVLNNNIGDYYFDIEINDLEYGTVTAYVYPDHSIAYEYKSKPDKYTHPDDVYKELGLGNHNFRLFKDTIRKSVESIANNESKYNIDDEKIIFFYSDLLENTQEKQKDSQQYLEDKIDKLQISINLHENRLGYNRSILPIHILSQNPLIVDGAGFPKEFSITENIERARKRGHDALVIENIDDPYYGHSTHSTQYVVWDPEQIISAETGRSLSKSQELCELQERETPPEDQYFTEQESLSPEASHAQQQLERIHPVFLDEKGRPKIIYHGSPTGHDIDECGYFDEDYYGKNTGVRDSSDIFTVFGSDNYNVAETYAQPGYLYTDSIEEQKGVIENANRVIKSLDKALNFTKNKEQYDNQRIETIADYVLQNDVALNDIQEKYSAVAINFSNNRTVHIFDDGSKIYLYNDSDSSPQKIPDKGQHDDLFVEFAESVKDHTQQSIAGKELVIPIHILSKNPLIVDGSEFPDKFSITDNINRAIEQGYDALVIENIDDTGDGQSITSTQYAVWDIDRIIDAETGRSLSKSQEFCELDKHETPPEDQYFTKAHTLTLDDEGIPRTVYHGSPKYQDIIESGYFDQDKLGSHTGVAQDHPGFYFTGSPDKAQFYSLDKEHADALYLPTQALSKNKTRIKELQEMLEYQSDIDGEYIPDIISFLEEQNISIESYIDSIDKRFDSIDSKNDSRRGIFEANLAIQDPLIIQRGDVINEKNLSVIGKFEKQAVEEGKDSLIIEDKESGGRDNIYVVFDTSKIIDLKTGKKMTPYEGPYQYEVDISLTSPEDQYLMVNIHGAYDRDNDSRRLVNRFETVPIFDSDFKLNNEDNLIKPPETKDVDKKVFKYFKNKPNQNTLIKSRPQLLNRSIGNLFFNKNNFKNKYFDNSSYQEQLIAPNCKLDKPEKYIKQGVMAHALRRV